LIGSDIVIQILSRLDERRVKKGADEARALDFQGRLAVARLEAIATEARLLVCLD